MDVTATVTDRAGHSTSRTVPVALSEADWRGQSRWSGSWPGAQSTPPPPQPPPPPAAGTFTAPASLADGQDCGARLTAWLKSLPAGSIADLAGRDYRVETKVKPDDLNAVTIRNGHLYRTVTDPAASTNFPNPFLWLLRPTGCVVDGLSFTGPNTTGGQLPGYGKYVAQYEAEAAIRAESFTDFTMRNVTGDGLYGDGVQLQKGVKARLYDSTFDRVGRQGITVIASDVLADNVDVLHGCRSGYDLEPDFGTDIVAGIEIRNAFTRTIGLPFASGGRGVVNDVWLHHNTSDGSSVPIVYVKASDGSRRANWRVEDHTHVGSQGSPNASFMFTRVDGVTVRRVTVPVAASQSRLAAWFTECGGPCEVTDSSWSQGLYYRNDTPAASQTLTVTGNTPVLTKAA